VVAEAFRSITAQLVNPPVDVETQLERLEQVAAVSAVVLGAALDIEKYRGLYHDVLVASAPDNPRATVTALIDRVAARDAGGVDGLLSVGAAARHGVDAKPPASPVERDTWQRACRS
jgi:hypothetical protein